jgi:low temperature requirement protein LtrA
MNVVDRRGLNLGIVLLAVGLYFLLRRELRLSGPGPILLLIGTILLAFSGLRGFRGPVVPACVLLGLGSGFLLRDTLDAWMPRWATLVLGLGCGLLLAAAIDRQAGRERKPSTLAPGIVLVAIAAATAVSINLRIPETLADAAWQLWPWALVAAGVVLVVQAARRRPTT